jgi:hypothetical protein
MMNSDTERHIGETMAVVLRERALVQTFGIHETNAREHCATQAARTAFQTAGALLSLIRSLPSVN